LKPTSKKPSTDQRKKSAFVTLPAGLFSFQIFKVLPAGTDSIDSVVPATFLPVSLAVAISAFAVAANRSE
jgi:hypothetical protein